MRLWAVGGFALQWAGLVDRHPFHLLMTQPVVILLRVIVCIIRPLVTVVFSVDAWRSGYLSIGERMYWTLLRVYRFGLGFYCQYFV